MHILSLLTLLSLLLTLSLSLSFNKMSKFLNNKKILVLFDVDGTLTEPREEANNTMKDFLKLLRNNVDVGIVGGSDLPKQQEQMGENIINEVDYSFSENGLVAYKDGQLIGKTSISNHLGEENIKSLVNFCLHYIADLDIPVKRGTFIEFRNGMINVSPIGRNCNKEERNNYEEFDLKNNIRSTFVSVLESKFAHLKLKYSIGGQISFDVFPEGWDKTYCLNFIPEGSYDEIHFFGDKTFKGGNDYEIFTHPRVIGHNTTSPSHTIEQCKQLFL
jgi:phosphomannomutase